RAVHLARQSPDAGAEKAWLISMIPDRKKSGRSAGLRPVVFGMEVEMSDDHQSSQSVVRMKKGRGRLPDPVWTKNGLQAPRHAMGPRLSSRFFGSPSLCSLDLP